MCKAAKWAEIGLNLSPGFQEPFSLLSMSAWSAGAGHVQHLERYEDIVEEGLAERAVVRRVDPGEGVCQAFEVDPVRDRLQRCEEAVGEIGRHVLLLVVLVLQFLDLAGAAQGCQHRCVALFEEGGRSTAR